MIFAALYVIIKNTEPLQSFGAGTNGDTGLATKGESLTALKKILV